MVQVGRGFPERNTALEEAVLPYRGTSGYAGTDTSRERAETEASDGTTGKRQHVTVHALGLTGYAGLTWKELAATEGMHHGQASAALSNLHKAHKIARLTERRDRCKVYVLLDYVGIREVERFVPNKGRYPQRGDQTEAWIRTWRDSFGGHSPNHPAWDALDDLLDEYRLAADTGQTLEEVRNGHAG